MSGLVVHVEPRSVIAVLGLAADAVRELSRPARRWAFRR
ncbi:hypothetical protein SAMN04488570_2756 [Nocardioides scoriae]|uniref:Uncharacterized protein n=1 Tax=Nocardioides scoriae TaxID=642780 RepID=A0A1H1V8V4_9ACTN|nr:hypothetical protein SAMN04488570_2756 [Nocardioides scoriae]